MSPKAKPAPRKALTRLNTRAWISLFPSIISGRVNTADETTRPSASRCRTLRAPTYSAASRVLAASSSAALASTSWTMCSTI